MRITALLIATLLYSSSANAEIYRWVDENGKTHYGDKVPAKYAKKEQQKLNDQGLTVETRQRELTQEEKTAAREKAEREKAEREALRTKQAEQARYDSFLRSTYPTLATLDRARDDRLAIMDGQVRNAEKSKKEAADALHTLKDRAANYTQNDKPVPDKLKSQIAAFQSTYDEAARRIGSVQAERDSVAEQYARDRSRLAELLDQGE